MNKKNTIYILLNCIVLLLNISCKKFLDQKINKTDVIPTTISDLKALLDNNGIMNQNGPKMLEVLSDDYYLDSDTWQALVASFPGELRAYAWDKDAPPDLVCWRDPYIYPINYANIVLGELPNVAVREGQQEYFNEVKGAALFYRSFAFLQLAQLFCKPFSIDNQHEHGIVLRLTSNISAKSERATVLQTYEQITKDLKEASELLPVKASYPTRPTKVAAYAALARTYLCMRDYANAGLHADKALLLYNKLIDYNTLVPVGNPPVTTFNEEVVFHNDNQSTVILGIANIDSNLYKSYHQDDLRKTVFFTENTGVTPTTYTFIGSYNGNLYSGSVFDGLTTDELYLTRAECYARDGNITDAMKDLNTLMKNRWRKSVPYPEITSSDKLDAINKILIERRKELVFRGQRWSDVRRLNLEGANISIKRTIGGVDYVLPPNDPRSVLLIPFEEVNRSGIPQNPR